jgi:hypothetical protein
MTDDDLKDLCRNLFDDAPAVGSRWRHYRTGGVYEIVALSLDEGSRSPVVTYRNLASGLAWTRRLEEWSQELLGPAGKYVPRFAPLE